MSDRPTLTTETGTPVTDNQLRAGPADGEDNAPDKTAGF